MNSSIPYRTLFAASAVAALSVLGVPATAHAMSADGSSYAVVLPWVIDSGSFQSRIAVENHGGGGTVQLTAYWVGDDLSAMVGQRVCSDANANPVPQTFTFAVNVDQVLEFDLGALLAEKCKGAQPAGSLGNRGTLTILMSPTFGQAKISASARVERRPGAGVTTLGYSQRGIPLGALEGSKLLMAGLRHGTVTPKSLNRIDCLISSFADATGGGELYRLTLKDGPGSVLGTTMFALKPWRAKIVNDVVKMVGVSGDYDALQVEVEPLLNTTSPSMVASCRTIDLANLSIQATALVVGKVYEPRDAGLKRDVDVFETPGWGKFRFDPAAGRELHVVFLRNPDMVTCSVSDPGLVLNVYDPARNLVVGGFQSTGEFFTGFRSDVNGGQAGAWGIEVEVNASRPPASVVDYKIRCVSGNGMSQIDRVAP